METQKDIWQKSTLVSSQSKKSRNHRIQMKQNTASSQFKTSQNLNSCSVAENANQAINKISFRLPQPQMLKINEAGTHSLQNEEINCIPASSIQNNGQHYSEHEFDSNLYQNKEMIESQHFYDHQIRRETEIQEGNKSNLQQINMDVQNTPIDKLKQYLSQSNNNSQNIYHQSRKTTKNQNVQAIYNLLQKQSMILRPGRSQIQYIKNTPSGRETPGTQTKGAGSHSRAQNSTRFACNNRNQLTSQDNKAVAKQQIVQNQDNGYISLEKIAQTRNMVFTAQRGSRNRSIIYSALPGKEYKTHDLNGGVYQLGDSQLNDAPRSINRNLSQYQAQLSQSKVKRFNEDLNIQAYCNGSVGALQSFSRNQHDTSNKQYRHISAQKKIREKGSIVINNFYSYSGMDNIGHRSLISGLPLAIPQNFGYHQSQYIEEPYVGWGDTHYNQDFYQSKHHASNLAYHAQQQSSFPITSGTTQQLSKDLQNAQANLLQAKEMRQELIQQIMSLTDIQIIQCYSGLKKQINQANAATNIENLIPMIQRKRPRSVVYSLSGRQSAMNNYSNDTQAYYCSHKTNQGIPQEVPMAYPDETLKIKVLQQHPQNIVSTHLRDLEQKLLSEAKASAKSQIIETLP